MKTVEITQKELDKRIGEARQEGFDMGVKQGRADLLPWNKHQALAGIQILDSLLDFLDERYELKHEDY